VPSVVIARALLTSAALLAGCTTGAAPCAGVPTCVRLDVDGLAVRTIDQLELDLVYADHHATTTVGVRGDPMELPFSIPLTLDLPSPPLITITAIAAGRLNGSVIGLDAATTTVQQGYHASLNLFLSAAHGCTEGRLYCGGTGDAQGDGESLYRCTDQVPIFYMRCSTGCIPRSDDHAVCAGRALCRDGGTYCGGHALDGDPGTLYVCQDFRATTPRPCPRGCVVHGDGDDACQ
jgi:hypothetical protein